MNDGFVKSKGKRLASKKVPDDFQTIRPTVKSFLVDQQIKVENIKKFQKACPIDFSDEMLELVPENYLDEDTPSIEEIQRDVDQIVRNTAAYLIKAKREDRV